MRATPADKKDRPGYLGREQKQTDKRLLAFVVRRHRPPRPRQNAANTNLSVVSATNIRPPDDHGSRCNDHRTHNGRPPCNNSAAWSHAACAIDPARANGSTCFHRTQSEKAPGEQERQNHLFHDRTPWGCNAFDRTAAPGHLQYNLNFRSLPLCFSGGS